MALGCPRGDRSRGQARHRAGEHTRKSAIDAECGVWSAGDGAGGVRCRWVRDGVPMTATSPSSVTESASSTDDPDAQARRANDGELSALQSDVTIDQVAADGGLTAAESNERFDKSVDSTQLYAEYRRLLAEQAALRRVATLVARGVGFLEVFGAVAEEMRRCVSADTAALRRFDTDGEIGHPWGLQPADLTSAASGS
jgi:hypothetical protein